MANQIPFVDYLRIGEDPALLAQECTACGARFFGRRNGCASCGGADFRQVTLASEGVVRTFTIVAFAAPGVDVPFVAAVVDLDGTSISANLRDVEPDPDHVTTGMKVRLTTYVAGVDAQGTEAVNFAFAPLT